MHSKTQSLLPAHSGFTPIDLAFHNVEVPVDMAYENLGKKNNPRNVTSSGQRKIAILCLLYVLQGVPTTLVLGSIPFLLREKLSYAQIATFSLSSYPYSLKLLWSPAIDAFFFRSIGRRKSWIIPTQLLIGTGMLLISRNVDDALESPEAYIYQLTISFTVLVILVATHGIALDGWALTFLPERHSSYTSACQTVGTTIGFFVSFTLFLSLNSQSFVDRWSLSRLTLGSYLSFWGSAYYLMAICLTLLRTEVVESSNEVAPGICAVYNRIWALCQLQHVQSVMIIHLFAKIAFAVNDNVTSLKMVDNGLQKGDLALVVLFSFPGELLGGWLAGNWMRRDRPLQPWIWMFFPRVVLCLFATLAVHRFPSHITPPWFLYLIGNAALSSFLSSVQLVSISRFHILVSDRFIGGTSMTLFGTFSTLGATWPKWFVFKGMDWLSVTNCSLPQNMVLSLNATGCASNQNNDLCDMTGSCVSESDGYYAVSALCMAFGVIFYVIYIIPSTKKLQALPLSAWRAIAD
ncbi:acetyl-coenzyme A transporter 1-domain-containing protein [Flagelloscypha sp. PMI_526]|nr:acetyl-coenzyme A transporter 1-domain-containing protein [Flagelloscypha sp. PMI_526]